jgi:hypothetical protein
MSSSPEARVRLVTRAILAIGFACAAVIYFVNAEPPEAPDFEFENSKKYLRELEVYGGKANVLATQFRHWFDGLWHGRSLAFTVAVISVSLALAYRFFASPLPPAVDGNRGGEENGSGRGA